MNPSNGQRQSAVPPALRGTAAAARCAIAYAEGDYLGCVSAANEALRHQFIPIVGLLEILALRRLDLNDEAEYLGGELLLRTDPSGGKFLLFMMVIDGAINPESFLREKVFSGSFIEVTSELEGEVCFYWGAKLVTEGSFAEAVDPLQRAANAPCDSIIQLLANSDLRIARDRAAVN